MTVYALMGPVIWIVSWIQSARLRSRAKVVSVLRVMQLGTSVMLGLIVQRFLFARTVRASVFAWLMGIVAQDSNVKIPFAFLITVHGLNV